MTMDPLRTNATFTFVPLQRAPDSPRVHRGGPYCDLLLAISRDRFIQSQYSSNLPSTAFVKAHQRPVALQMPEDEFCKRLFESTVDPPRRIRAVRLQHVPHRGMTVVRVTGSLGVAWDIDLDRVPVPIADATLAPSDGVAAPAPLGDAPRSSCDMLQDSPRRAKCNAPSSRAPHAPQPVKDVAEDEIDHEMLAMGIWDTEFPAELLAEESDGWEFSDDGDDDDLAPVWRNPPALGPPSRWPDHLPPLRGINSWASPFDIDTVIAGLAAHDIRMHVDDDYYVIRNGKRVGHIWPRGRKCLFVDCFLHRNSGTRCRCTLPMPTESWDELVQVTKDLYLWMVAGTSCKTLADHRAVADIVQTTYHRPRAAVVAAEAV